MKIKDLLNVPERWADCYEAVDRNGIGCRHDYPYAVKWSFFGAYVHCYAYSDQRKLVSEKLRLAMLELGYTRGQSLSIYKLQNYAEIKAIVTRADV